MDFSMVAMHFLSFYRLTTPVNTYQLCDLEFYYHNVNHPDPYVHCHEDQRQGNTWYFHRHGNGRYKGGNYRGIDLVLSADGVTYYGVLLRGMRRESDGFLIEGPCLCVKQILADYGMEEIDDLTGGTTLGLFANDRNLVITPANYAITLHAGPRIGLSNRYLPWRDLAYRFTNGLPRRESKKLRRCQ